MKPVLHVLVGPPGCGKSRWAAGHAEDKVIVSTDAVRKQELGDEADQSANHYVHNMARYRAGYQLLLGNDVIYDATSATPAARLPLLALARQVEAYAVAYVFRTPYGVCVARDAARLRTVGEDVVARYWWPIAGLSVARLRAEGFNGVHEVSGVAPEPIVW